MDNITPIKVECPVFDLDRIIPHHEDYDIITPDGDIVNLLDLHGKIEPIRIIREK